MSGRKGSYGRQQLWDDALSNSSNGGGSWSPWHEGQDNVSIGVIVLTVDGCNIKCAAVVGFWAIFVTI
jgi:hypothetical protein